MCLYSEQKVPMVARENIVCYKILIPVNGKLVTPYRDFIFNTNVVTKDEAEEHIGEIFGKTEVSSGYFHSFTTKERVLEEIKVIQRKAPKGTTIKVFKVIIPEGTLYYVGQRDDICSKALIIVE